MTEIIHSVPTDTADTMRLASGYTQDATRLSVTDTLGVMRTLSDIFRSAGARLEFGDSGVFYILPKGSLADFEQRLARDMLPEDGNALLVLIQDGNKNAYISIVKESVARTYLERGTYGQGNHYFTQKYPTGVWTENMEK